MCDSRKVQPRARVVLVVLLTPALLVGLLTTVGPFGVDPLALWGGVAVGHRPGWLPGYPTIDPNQGATSFALGVRAALDLLLGQLPLWNHYEGLGAPLLGEMQSAALFPPTWLLLLPHGQAIEHASLQAVAGLGTYLFLRRFGLGATAALAGGLLFEFNGVFAWLRNAVFNPVAFLPWLFYTIESLFRLEYDRGAGRWWVICLGAVVAALALYAGFPEVVYFYALLLVLWAGLRAIVLPWRRAAVFIADLLAVTVLALLISAPLLIAFGHFLREAAVGGHHGVEFRDHFLPPHAFLVALLPYVFGPISAAPLPSVGAVWGDIGGYLGVTPLLLAVGGLICSWRSAASWLLAGWVVLAVGASHGVAILHGAMTAVPLVAIAAYGRYLDAGWIFASVVLGAVFVDRVGAMGAAERRRVGTLAGVIVLVLSGFGVWLAWTVLAEVWPAPWQQLSVGAGAVLVCLFLLALRRERPARAVAGLAIVEAAALFMVPFASTPRVAGVDRALIGFLRDHAGLQRVAIASGSGLAPNFGSIFRIPLMNYDDLPVPARTARFVTGRLDATNDGVIFSHYAAPGDAGSRSRFLAALPGYAQAGVRYVLSVDDFAAEPLYPSSARSPVAVPLPAGQKAIIEMDASTSAHTIGGISILIGTYGGAADGIVRADLCQGLRCAGGTARLAGALDNRFLPVAFDAPVTIVPGAPVRLSIAKEGGHHEVALWMQPSTEAGLRRDGVVAPAGYLPVIDRIEATDPIPILRTATTTVFELRSARPYASAPGCRLDVVSHDRMNAECEIPSRLLRLEVFMGGWTAQVNGVDTPIIPVEDTFQGVNLPEGTSVVAFRYAPLGLRASVPVALAALLLCLAVLSRTCRVGWLRGAGRGSGSAASR